jgi:hypothetical protein
MALAAPLVVACFLKPDPFGTGYGTHRQMGLPECGLVKLLNIRCPSCGMTTSYTYAVRGQLHKAVRSNSGGTMLAVMSMFFAPWLAMSAALGRWWLWRPREGVLIALGVLIVLTTLIDWTVRLILR